VTVPIALSEHLVSAPAAERLPGVRQLGADGVELIVGPHAVEQHPLWQPGGPTLLRTQAQMAGVAVPSVFAGFVLDQPPHAADPAMRRRAVQTLEHLLDACAEAGIAAVVLPLFGGAEVDGDAASGALVETLTSLAEKAGPRQITLALETPLPIPGAQALLARVANPAVRVAYDVGQAAELGRDASADLEWLGELVCQVRVRDATPDGRRVPLGQGAVNFPALARALARRTTVPWLVLEGVAGAESAGAVRRDLDFLHAAFQAR
jgi:sugar phosphate isomerase/epimerase